MRFLNLEYFKLALAILFFVILTSYSIVSLNVLAYNMDEVNASEDLVAVVDKYPKTVELVNGTSGGFALDYLVTSVGNHFNSLSAKNVSFGVHDNLIETGIICTRVICESNFMQHQNLLDLRDILTVPRIPTNINAGITTGFMLTSSAHYLTQLAPKENFLTITVIDDIDNSPIKGAIVSIHDRKKVTDVNGEVRFENLPKNKTFNVLAQFQNFNPGTTTVTISEIEKERTATIYILPGNLSVIQGRVIDAESNEGVKAALVRTVAGGSAPLHYAITDSFGYYFITDVEPGTYSLIASADGYNKSADKPLVHQNNSVMQNFRLKPHHDNPDLLRHIIYGNVDSNDGVLLENVEIRVDGTYRYALTDSLGYYALTGLTADGTYTISAFAPGFFRGEEEVTLTEIKNLDQETQSLDDDLEESDDKQKLSYDEESSEVNYHMQVMEYINDDLEQTTVITRAEMFQIFFDISTDPTKFQNYGSSRFSDIHTSAWYFTAIAYFERLGLLSGFPDGSFRPNQLATNAEFISFAIRFFEVSLSNTTSDTANHWAEVYLTLGYNHGWIDYFKASEPIDLDDAITRAQSKALINFYLLYDRVEQY